MTDLWHLRIGTADRREAVARIDRAAAEGRLTPAEASDRAAGVGAAITYADLDPLIADLPPIAPAPVAMGWSVTNPLPISGGMSREKRDGAWEIPPFLRLSGELGTVRLDCREAVCLAPVVDVDVSAGAGRVKIIAPVGRLRVLTGTTRQRRRARRELERRATPASGWVEERSEMPNADDLR